MIKAVVFDLDDTLISERQYMESGYRYISKIISSKLNENQDKLYQLLLDLLQESPQYIFNRLFDKLQIPYTKTLILDLVNQYHDHFPEIEFYEDVLPCLQNLKQRNIKIGIITDGYANAQSQKLKALRAYEIFDELIITDELGREYWKPHSKAFEMMRERMNIEYDEMIYVGDNPEKDFYIGAIYPIKTVRIYRENEDIDLHKDKSYYKNISENYEICSLNELLKIIT